MRLMYSMYLNTLVYDPGAFFLAQSTPQLTIPTRCTVPSGAVVTRGPPESPLYFYDLLTNFSKKKEFEFKIRATWQASLPPSK